MTEHEYNEYKAKYEGNEWRIEMICRAKWMVCRIKIRV